MVPPFLLNQLGMVACMAAMAFLSFFMQTQNMISSSTCHLEPLRRNMYCKKTISHLTLPSHSSCCPCTYSSTLCCYICMSNIGSSIVHSIEHSLLFNMYLQLWRRGTIAAKINLLSRVLMSQPTS